MNRNQIGVDRGRWRQGIIDLVGACSQRQTPSGRMFSEAV